MDTLKFITKEGDPDPKDFKALSSGLLAYHESKGHRRTWKTFSIFLKDNNNKPHAGIIATCTWNGMHIDSLWVDESIRGKEYGSTLMKMAENEGKKRGCTIAYTDTFSWQAGGFYEKLGYTVYGKLDGFPEDNSLTYYRKNL